MKKLIVGLLMTAMICSLAACGGKNQSSAGTDTSAVGETAEHADSSASSEDVVAYQAGTWDGVTYTNTSLGMCLTLPDGWQRQSMNLDFLVHRSRLMLWKVPDSR